MVKKKKHYIKALKSTLTIDQKKKKIPHAHDSSKRQHSEQSRNCGPFKPMQTGRMEWHKLKQDYRDPLTEESPRNLDNSLGPGPSPTPSLQLLSTKGFAAKQSRSLSLQGLGVSPLGTQSIRPTQVWQPDRAAHLDPQSTAT
jgi:hypothetical protein